MNNEEYQRIKEAEKAHLRQIREIKGKLKSAQPYARVNNALGEMEKGASAVADTHEEMLDKLRQQNAAVEARMEIAMENVPQNVQPVLSDEEIRQQKAQSLLAQFKAEMGLQESSKSSVENSVEKSIGRPAAANSENQENISSLPERTIGRQR